MLKNALDIFINNHQLFLQGIKNTLYVSLIGTIAGLGIGFILSLLRSLEVDAKDSWLMRTLKIFSVKATNFYINFVRGTPMMVQAVFIYYALYRVLNWSPMTASLWIVSFNTASYMAEILRSGIQSISKGQSEAAKALGMSKLTTFRKIIMPQALRNSFPSIGNEFVVNIKDTSVLNAIQLTELYFQGMSYAGRTYMFTETMLVLLVIYFVLTYGVTLILNQIEKTLQKPRTINLAKYNYS